MDRTVGHNWPSQPYIYTYPALHSKYKDILGPMIFWAMARPTVLADWSLCRPRSLVSWHLHPNIVSKFSGVTIDVRKDLAQSCFDKHTITQPSVNLNTYLRQCNQRKQLAMLWGVWYSILKVDISQYKQLGGIFLSLSGFHCTTGSPKHG